MVMEYDGDWMHDWKYKKKNKLEQITAKINKNKNRFIGNTLLYCIYTPIFLELFHNGFTILFAFVFTIGFLLFFYSIHRELKKELEIFSNKTSTYWRGSKEMQMAEDEANFLKEKYSVDKSHKKVLL